MYNYKVELQMVVSYFFIFFKKKMWIKCKGIEHYSGPRTKKNILFPILFACLIRLRG